MFIVKCNDHQEAMYASQAIASYLNDKRCQCEVETGYECNNCIRLQNMDEEKHFELMQRYQDLVYKKRVEKHKK